MKAVHNYALTRKYSTGWRNILIFSCCCALISATVIYSIVNVFAQGTSGSSFNPASASVQADYKLTSNLTDADKADAYQKNYTYAAGSTNSAYLYKTAEWVDKEQGKAKITLTGKAPAHEITSCVYVVFGKMRVCRARSPQAPTR
jgi:hypothetical protein